MQSVLKTILNRLEKIEKSLEKEKEVDKDILKIPQVKTSPAKTSQTSVADRANQFLERAKEEASKIVRQAEEEARKIRQESLLIEKRTMIKQESIDSRLEQLARDKQVLASKIQQVEAKIVDVEEKREKLIAKLEKVAQLTREEAKKLIIDAQEERLREEIAKKIKEAEAEAKQESERRSREILIDAMRHGATDYVPEYTVSTIKITDEDFKGRIIGKEGRNIRAFEMATGIDVDLDEEGVIRLSSFDPVRREIARITLEKLIRDGRIQPIRIEEIVKQTKKEIDKLMFEAGEKLCHSVGVYNMPVDIIAILGRFKYRFSYGQNMVLHTLEETKIGVHLAQELNADVNVVKLGCLLHDIGKVITDREGSHVDLGVELLKKHGIPPQVVDCVASHHEDIPFLSIEAVIVYIADAISGARPGARYEDIEEYVKRLKQLEEIATSFKGVEKAYALAAGRELRVIVDPDKLDDVATTITTDQIANAVKKKFPTFPGQIKITAIREMRVSKAVN